jgi:hypothetical protein
MSPPAGWQNPITAQPGQLQQGVDPLRLLPARRNLHQRQLDAQRAMLLAGIPRTSPIMVTRDGVIWDGHHAVRAAAEEGRTVEVLVIDLTAKATSSSILNLAVR